MENGHVTGRNVGDPGTNLGLELIRGTADGGNRHNYVTQTKDGRILRSTSLYMKNDSGQMIGSLCINFDITELTVAEKTLQSLTASGLLTLEQAVRKLTSFPAQRFKLGKRGLIVPLYSADLVVINPDLSFHNRMKQENQSGVTAWLLLMS
ncbi:PAS domain-containing protein [Paenibacillus mendelii]|uniref:PAS domain-containing protein n=1 Tax=Paenibacillus mendelii TaxID=206163 RepID=A0ABV6J2A1_9BACL